MYAKAKQLARHASSSALMLGSLMASGAWAGGDAAEKTGASGHAVPGQLNMTQSVTDLGHRIYDLHMLVFWICVVVGVLVFGLMFYSVLFHRKSLGQKPATFHENTTLELLWTVIPFLILIGIAFPATKTLLEVYNTSDYAEEAELDVLVTGYRWYWKYEYLLEDGENVSFFSKLTTPVEQYDNRDGSTQPKGQNYLVEVDNPLVLPVGKKTRFLVTANDVIHSWWVPDLAVKKDAIPGFINEIWSKPLETGVYRGQCAELCGAYHAFMPIVVNVVEQEEFDSFISEKQAEAAKIAELMNKTFSLEEQMAAGEEVYKSSCLACHGANGEGGVGNAIAGSSIATGDVAAHLDVVINGVPGTSMGAFGSQLNDVDLAAVVTYQRNAFGNNMGDTVQPIDVLNFKQGQ